MYAFKNEYLKAVRHTITPSLSYTFIPDFGNPQYGYWDSYAQDNGVMCYYSKYENRVYNDIPGRGKTSSIGFSLSNNLEIKVRNLKDTSTYTKKISLIDDLRGSISYNLAADSMNWSYFTLSGSTNLLKRVNVRYSATFDPYSVKENPYEDQRKRTPVIRSRTLMWDQYGRLWRQDNSVWDISTSLNLGPMKDREKYPDKGPNSPSISKNYSSFKVPWTLDLSYNISLPRKYYYTRDNKVDSIGSEVIQSLSIHSKLSITKNWNVDISTGWDFQAQKITYTKLDFYRDLHCWEMSFQWIPFGGMQRYEFKINVKASMFEDLKLEKKKTYGDVFD